MSLYDIFDNAGSALTAQSARMNVATSNLANANSAAGPDGEPYRARRVIFELNAKPGQETGGVKVSGVVESQAPFKMQYNPEHPLANEQGYVRMPNVNPTEEMVEMIAAARSYQTNVEVLS